MKIQHDRRITSPTSQLPKPEDYKETAVEAWKDVQWLFNNLQLSEWIWDKTYFDWENHLEITLKALIKFEVPDKDKFQQALKEAQERLGCANERTHLDLYLLNGGTDLPALDADLDELDDDESLFAYDRRDIDLLRELRDAGATPWDKTPEEVISNNFTRFILFDFFLSHAITVVPRSSIDESLVTLTSFLDEMEADLGTQWNPIDKYCLWVNDDEKHRHNLLRRVANIRSKLDARDDSVYLDLWLEAFSWNEWKLHRHRADSIAKVDQIGDLLFQLIHVRKRCGRGDSYVTEVDASPPANGLYLGTLARCCYCRAVLSQSGAGGPVGCASLWCG